MAVLTAKMIVRYGITDVDMHVILQDAIDALDEHYTMPDYEWQADIVEDAIDVNSLNHCILGQLFGTWTKAPVHLQELPAFGSSCAYLGEEFAENLSDAWRAYLHSWQAFKANRPV